MIGDVGPALLSGSGLALCAAYCLDRLNLLGANLRSAHEEPGDEAIPADMQAALDALAQVEAPRERLAIQRAGASRAHVTAAGLVA